MFTKGQRITLAAIAVVLMLTAVGCGPSGAPAPRTLQTLIAERGIKELKLFVMGDSSVGSGLGPAYAARLKQDSGVNVSEKTFWVSSWGSDGMLTGLHTNNTLRQWIAESDVIVFHVPRGRFSVCASKPNDDACWQNALTLFNQETDAIFAELVALRSPSDAMIRTMDAYSHWSLQESKQQGWQDLITRYWLAGNQHQSEIAAKYNIPIAPVYAAFNGPKYDEDPKAKGLLMDDTHPTQKGDALRVDLIAKLGYDLAPK